MTDTERDLLAAIALNPKENTPRLMLADEWLANATTVKCPKCKGLCGKTAKRYKKGAGGAAEYWEICSRCKGLGSVSDDHADRAELIKIQVELSGHSIYEQDYEDCRWCGGSGDTGDYHASRNCHHCEGTGKQEHVTYAHVRNLRIREHKILQSHPEWFPVCPVCDGSGWRRNHTPVTGRGHECPTCTGTGRIGTFERGLIRTLTVPTLETVLVPCDYTAIAHRGEGLHAHCRKCSGHEWILTPWASALVRDRERWPALREVRIANRVPADFMFNGELTFAFDNWGCFGDYPHYLPTILLKELQKGKLIREGQVGFQSLELARAALGQAIWRILLRLAGKE